MKRGLVIIVLMLSACSDLPVIRQVPLSMRTGITSTCMKAYPGGQWTAVHSIDITLPGGGHSMMLGVTSRTAHGLHSVLMSPEGMVLFQGDLTGGKIHVQRAVHPMDDPEFQRRMFNDIRRLFFPPGQGPALVGRAQKRIICRWVMPGRVVDVTPGDPLVVREYRHKRLRLVIRYRGPFKGGFAHRMVLQTRGLLGYKMVFTLVSAKGRAR